jgi:hypothetical protein
MIEDKLKSIQAYLGKKVIMFMPLQTGGVQQQELTLKSAWVNKDMVLVNFNEYEKYTVNADIVGTVVDNKVVMLYSEV